MIRILISDKYTNKFSFYIQNLFYLLLHMSLSTSKSKTQLAYARSGKAITKPKNKNNSINQTHDVTKSKHVSRNSTGNIYESIMGQIQPTQQDYIKNLIVKNERESLKQNHKTGGGNGQNKKVNGKKNEKQPDSSKKIPNQLHQRTKSQAQLVKQIVKENQQKNINSKTQISQKKTEERQQTEVSCQNQYQQRQHESVYVEKKNQNDKNSNLKREYSNSNVMKKQSTSLNPIIQALNNTSSSFAHKLQNFQLQYPLQQRQQRSTHKKSNSKLPTNYFSCQSSPKNITKNTYSKEFIVTNKPQIAYNFSKNDKISASPISPVNSKSNSSQHYQNTKNQGNFLQCLNDYLSALNCPQTIENNKKPLMKRKTNKSNTKQYISHPFTLGKQQQEEETIVLDNYHKGQSNSKMLIYSPEKLCKMLEKMKKKNLELNSMVDFLNQKLTKSKKKENKLKQNQQNMIEWLNSLNQQLTQEKRQKRKLEEVVRQFQSKIRGISRGKQRQKNNSFQKEERPQRKTIYGCSSMANSIHYQNQPVNNFNNSNYRINDSHLKQSYDPNAPVHILKHQKNASKNRFSSLINNINQEYSNNIGNEDMEYENYQPYQKRQIQREAFNKNRTQKINKIISSFDLNNNILGEDADYDYMKGRNSVKNQTCGGKKANYLNSSLPQSTKNKKGPMTPKMIEQLFKQKKRSNHRDEVYDDSESDEEVRQAREGFFMHYNEHENGNNIESSEEQYQNDEQGECSSEQELEEEDDVYKRNKNGNGMLIRMR